jgi:hypothetical protein
MIGGAWARELISSDQFVLRVLDRSISKQDIFYLIRDLKALDCVYEDSIVIAYFEKNLITKLERFIQDFPIKHGESQSYLHEKEDLLKQIRLFFKMLRFSQDQNTKVSPKLSHLIKESAKVNKCRLDFLYKDNLRTNFKILFEMELYLRSRYEGQIKNSRRNFNMIRPSINLFLESLDKQFQHEYFW